MSPKKKPGPLTAAPVTAQVSEALQWLRQRFPRDAGEALPTEQTAGGWSLFGSCMQPSVAEPELEVMMGLGIDGNRWESVGNLLVYLVGTMFWMIFLDESVVRIGV